MKYGCINSATGYIGGQKNFIEKNNCQKLKSTFTQIFQMTPPKEWPYKPYVDTRGPRGGALKGLPL